MKKIALAAATVIVAALAIGGCSSNSGGESKGWTAADATATSTPRSIAAATIDYVGKKPTRAASTLFYSNFPKGIIGADVTFGTGRKKLEITTVVSHRKPKFQVTSCRHKDPYDGCVEKTVNGHRQVTVWQYLEPEEDPGILEITSFRTGEIVWVSFSGPDITKNPTTGGIPLDEQRLEDLAASPVIGYTTAQQYVTAGDKLSVWSSASR